LDGERKAFFTALNHFVGLFDFPIALDSELSTFSHSQEHLIAMDALQLLLVIRSVSNVGRVRSKKTPRPSHTCSYGASSPSQHIVKASV
jgi:hypothetical protein